MSQFTTNLISAIILALAASTLFQLWKQRENILMDELDEEARTLAWRVALFLILPFVVWIDLRATVVACEYFGGWVKDWSYGFLWYSAIPHNLPHADLLLPTIFAGVLVQILLVISVLPSLFFRPHPFLSSIVSYTVLLILVSNLIVDPIAGLLGMGSSRWQIAYASIARDDLSLVLCVYAVFSTLFLLALQNRSFRIAMAELTNPVLAEQLRIALSESQLDRSNQYQSCRLAILFEKVGMRSYAERELRHLKRIAAFTVYLPFVEGFIHYRRRNFKKARYAFEQAASFAQLQDQLRAIFLSAAACSAYGQGDSHASINLAERALEFDENSSLARMVKVDAYLKLGRKEQAGEEVLAVLKRGVSFDAEERVPLDPELTLRLAFRFQKDLQNAGSLERKPESQKVLTG